MTISLAHKGFLGAAFVLAGIYGFFGVGALFGHDDGDVNLAGGLTAVSVAAAIVAGIFMSMRWPVAGGALVVVFTVPLAVFVWWFFFIPPALALLIVVLGVVALRQRLALR